MKDLTQYFDPILAESVSGYTLTMRLHLHLDNGMRFIRDYYDVEMSNGDLLIYMTTDELNCDYNYTKYNEEFSFYFDHVQAVKDMQNNETLGLFAFRSEGIRAINSIIYYEPEIISENFKQAIQNELIEQIEGYTERDFSLHQLDLIRSWIDNEEDNRSKVFG